MTNLKMADIGIENSLFIKVAQAEGKSEEFIRKGVVSGEIVILYNKRHKNGEPVAVGKGLKTKVSASIGLYRDEDTIEVELEKLDKAIKAGTDTLMDLSVRGNIDEMRRKTIASTSKPIGSLPLYQAMQEAEEKYGSSLSMKVDELFEVIERHAKDGVDFIALHCGTTRDIIDRAKREKRIDPLVSYGASHLIGWMIHNEKENPLFEHFGRLLEIAKKYDVVLSFADGMRPGCMADSLDGAQVQELVVIGELVKRAQEFGVQVMVKGPGHIPLDQIEATVILQKALCHQAPYFVFGPLVNDTAVGYDHISAAIGGALSAYAGADFLCYVTPAEHIGLPDVTQVHEGVIAARIAAHSADIAKGIEGASDWDLEMSVARKKMDFRKQIELSIDPETAERMYRERSGDFESECTMCGKYCAMVIVSKYLKTGN